MKALSESKELPNRQVYLRRIGLRLVRIKVPVPDYHDFNNGEFLFKFPILEFVEETSKIMLMNEFELVYWYHLLDKYLSLFAYDRRAVQRISARSVRVLFF